MQKLVLKKYAHNTVKTYVSYFEALINFDRSRPLNDSNEHDILRYLKELFGQGKSDSYVHQAIKSIKLYYEIVQSMPNRFYHLERPRKKKKLPTVLSAAEIKFMFRSVPNLKHKCIIGLLYSAGLHRNELIQLQMTDIESRRMMIRVHQGKGNKDRYTILSKSLLEDLRKYYLVWRPVKYLFEGPGRGKYSSTSVANIVRGAAKKAGINKRVAPQFCYSFARKWY